MRTGAGEDSIFSASVEPMAGDWEERVGEKGAPKKSGPGFPGHCLSGGH